MEVAACTVVEVLDRAPPRDSRLRPRQLYRFANPLRVTSAVEGGLAVTREVGVRPSREDSELGLVVNYELSGRIGAPPSL